MTKRASQNKTVKNISFLKTFFYFLQSRPLVEPKFSTGACSIGTCVSAVHKFLENTS